MEKDAEQTHDRLAQIENKCNKLGSAIKWFWILLSIFIVLAVCYFIYTKRPDYSSFSTRSNSIREEYHNMLGELEKMQPANDANYSKLNKNELQKALYTMRQIHKKDSLLSVAACVRLDLLERDMREECDRMHVDYSSYLVQLQTWTAVLIGVITLITIIIGYILKNDLNDKIKDFEHTFVEDIKRQEAILENKMKNTESINRCSLLLSSIKAISWEINGFVSSDIKIIVQDLLCELIKLNRLFIESLQNQSDNQEWRLDLKCILINYLAVTSELEVIVNLDYETSEAFTNLKAEVFELLKKLKTIDRETVISVFKELQNKLGQLSQAVEEDMNIC